MPVQADKKSRFLEAISNIAEHRKEEIIQEIAEKKELSLKQEELKALKENYELIQSELIRNRSEIVSEYSRKEIQQIDALIEKRNAIEEAVHSAVTEKLHIFRLTPEYQNFLRESAMLMNQILGEGSKLTVRPEDMIHADLIQKAFGKDCTVEADEGIVLGGIIGEDYAQGIVANDSLDIRLEEQREWFMENSALYITGEAGGNIDADE